MKPAILGGEANGETYHIAMAKSVKALWHRRKLAKIRR
jgi:hypothetical protein